MISAVISGSSGLDSGPSRCSWARHFIFTVPQVYKFNARGNPVMARLCSKKNTREPSGTQPYKLGCLEVKLGGLNEEKKSKTN